MRAANSHPISRHMYARDTEQPFLRIFASLGGAFTALTLSALMIFGSACSKPAEAPPSQHDGDPSASKVSDQAGEPGTDSAGKNGVEQARAGDGQWYRAMFELKDADIDEVPFYLFIPEQPHRGQALAGYDAHQVTGDARWYGNEVAVNFPLFRTRLFMRQDDSKVLRGHLMSKSPTASGRASLALMAEPVASPDPAKRFKPPADEPRPETAFDPAGDWLATAPESGPWRLSFENKGDGVIVVNLVRADGSVFFMIGNQFGNQLLLSSFDGVNAFLLKARYDPESKQLSGRWLAGVELDERYSFTAERSDDIKLPQSGVAFVANRTPLKLFELGLPQYRGKPVIVEFGASWCPPCTASAPVLRNLYEQHHKDGLEIVTLLFELIEDEEIMRRQADLYIEKLQIPWTVVPVRGPIAHYWNVVPHDSQDAEINLPLTLFVNADGTLREAHMGFPGPESKAEYDLIVARYGQVAKELVSATK